MVPAYSVSHLSDKSIYLYSAQIVIKQTKQQQLNILSSAEADDLQKVHQQKVFVNVQLCCSWKYAKYLSSNANVISKAYQWHNLLISEQLGRSNELSAPFQISVFQPTSADATLAPSYQCSSSGQFQ